MRQTCHLVRRCGNLLNYLNIYHDCVITHHLVHWQNPVPARECGYAAWLRESLAPQVLRVPGFVSLQLLVLQPVQLQPANPQPWRLCTLYELDAVDLAEPLRAFSELARHEPLGSGWLQGDAAHVFELTRPQLNSSLSIDMQAPLHFGFVMGNCIEGKEAEYDAWYDNIHTPEVLATPDFVGMRRGKLATSQSAPQNAQPANRLVLLQIRSYDLHASIKEFIGRALGTSPSGIKWQPRELAASFASLNRTTHVLTPFTPRLPATSHG